MKFEFYNLGITKRLRLNIFGYDKTYLLPWSLSHSKLEVLSNCNEWVQCFEKSNCRHEHDCKRIFYFVYEDKIATCFSTRRTYVHNIFKVLDKFDPSYQTIQNLEINFSSAVGVEEIKSTNYKMLPGETVEEAWTRYCNY